MAKKIKADGNGDATIINRLDALGADGDAAPAKGKKQVIDKRVVISAPKFHEVAVLIRGYAPYVQNKFSQKAIEMMKDKQKLGSLATKNKKKEPKDFMACYEAAKHVSQDGWCGIPAPAFRNGIISACRLVGFKMTLAKLSVFCLADGFDRHDFTPLVRITKGEPRYGEHFVRNESGVADIRPRPMWEPGWEAVVRLRFDSEQFTGTDVVNLLRRVGDQVGVGEGRPDSPNSTGQGWGMFEVVETVHAEDDNAPVV